MSQDKLNREWMDLAPAWIEKLREGADPVRDGLLDPLMLSACGDVEGLRVLDSGCGEGRFCRMLAERGAAYVLGLDSCPRMVEAAQELQSEHDEYRVADVQDLGSLDDESFNLAVSYLNQCDLPDFNRNTQEVFRVLKSGGRFIVANLHPMRSAMGAWQRTDDGQKQHVILDRYFDESERHWTMIGVEITNFHRSLSTYVRSFLDAGFGISDITEPTTTEEQVANYPDLDDELRVPNFIIYVLSKS